jgi:DNA-binding transcriptional ArsR family regulator
MAKKNSNFIQLYRNNVNVFRAIAHNPTAVSILSIVIEHMDSKNNVLLSIPMMCKMTGKSKPAVYAALKVLKERNVVEVSNMGGACLFTCNSNFAWTSYAGSREKYAKTQAVVLVDASELPGGDLNENLGRGIIADKDGVL